MSKVWVVSDKFSQKEFVFKSKEEFNQFFIDLATEIKQDTKTKQKIKNIVLDLKRDNFNIEEY